MDLVLLREAPGWLSRPARAGMAALALALLWCSTARAADWVEWKDCQLAENDSNDGDSFHVKSGRKEYILRLYFVDAPETDNGFPERVAEQGKYFGITPEQAVQLGERAKTFTEEKLSQPFVVRTRKQNAMGRSNTPRFYALIETSAGDLGELLVANGMARVHGIKAAPPDRGDARDEKQKLVRLEQTARLQKLGGWNGGAGGMTVGLPGQSGSRAQSAFDAFFHPENAADAAPAPAIVRPSARPAIVPAKPSPPPSAAATTAATDGKLDVNAATSQELIKLPGIGPVLAGRIIDARPFQSADELRRVKGIGKKKFAELRPFFAPEP